MPRHHERLLPQLGGRRGKEREMIQCTGNETRMERWMKLLFTLPRLAVNTGGLSNRADKRGKWEWGGGGGHVCCPL